MSFNLLDKGGIVFLITALWEKVKTIVPTSAKDIGALPNTGGTIKGKLSVDVDADGANPELRVAQGRVDILKTDGGGYPTALFEGRYDSTDSRIILRPYEMKAKTKLIDIDTHGTLAGDDNQFVNYNLHKADIRFMDADIYADGYLRISGIASSHADKTRFGPSAAIVNYGRGYSWDENDDNKIGFEAEQNNSHVRIYGKDINIGYPGDYCIQYTKDYRLKLRAGNQSNGSNIELGQNGISMWTNGGFTIMNSDGEAAEVCLLQDNGINAFYGDIGLWGLLFGNSNITNPTNKYQRAIELYKDSNTLVRFYSDGGWEFGSGDADNFVPVFEIEPKKKVSIDFGGTTNVSDENYNKIEILKEKIISKCYGPPYLCIALQDANISSTKEHGGIRIHASAVSPLNDNTSLGESYNKWTDIYAANGTIQTSDRNEKNTLTELSVEQAQDLIYGLKPSTYKMNNGTSGRTHWGMISQDIEKLLEELGWDSKDFAGFIKSPKVEIIYEDENGNKLEKPIEYIIEGECSYSLRYDEFIAPLIKVVQTQHEEIQKQEKRIEALEKRLELLEQ